MSSAFRTAVRRANIENFRFHDLRHTAASYLAMNGENHLTIASILGHKTLSMVKRYAHLNLKHTALALERLQTHYEIFLREKEEE
nr:tyrosine-type recombinase/integrase [Beggiatoa alba]